MCFLHIIISCNAFHSFTTLLCRSCLGSGKTTLLSQLSLDFAQQGRPVLWGSYHKTAALNSLSADKVQAVANDFEALPLRFLNFHGSTHIDKVRIVFY